MMKYNIYFPIKAIPIIETRIYGYIVNFKDLEYINETYGLSYTDSISYILQENNINSCTVAIDEWKIFNNYNIVNEIHNDYVIIPTSKNNLMYRYVDYVLEQASYSENYDLFLYEGLVEQKYFDDFLIYNEGFKDNVRTLGSNVATDVKQVATGIRTTAQQAKQYYNHELEQVSGNNPPSLANRVQAGVNIAKNIGNNVQQAAGIISDHVKNQYNQQLNRITGGESPSKIAKTKAVGYVAKNYIAKGAGTIIDNTDKALTLASIDPNNPDIVGTASDLIIPGLPQATAFLLNRRGQLKMGAKMIQIATSEKAAKLKAAINQKIQDEKAKLSSLSGQAKISCQQTINNLKQQLNNLMSKNN